MSEEERPSKGQEGSEIKTNSRGSHDKTKSGEYILSRPPKKTGGKEAVEFDTITTMSCGTTLTFENSNSTITNDLEYWKEPTIVRMENVGTGTSIDREKNEKKGDMGVIKEDLPCGVFDLWGVKLVLHPNKYISLRGRRSEISRFVKHITLIWMDIRIMFPGDGKLQRPLESEKHLLISPKSSNSQRI